jgi:hypothetical protein
VWQVAFGPSFIQSQLMQNLCSEMDTIDENETFWRMLNSFGYLSTAQSFRVRALVGGLKSPVHQFACGFGPDLKQLACVSYRTLIRRT